MDKRVANAEAVIGRVKGGAAFWALLIGEVAIVLCAIFTKIAFLWYNVIGAVMVVIFGVLISKLDPSEPTI